MINAVSFTIKGDYNQLRLVRGEGQSYVEMQLSYSNGCQYARFKFEDFKKAVEALAIQDKNNREDWNRRKRKNKLTWNKEGT